MKVEVISTFWLVCCARDYHVEIRHGSFWIPSLPFFCHIFPGNGKNLEALVMNNGCTLERSWLLIKSGLVYPLTYWHTSFTLICSILFTFRKQTLVMSSRYILLSILCPLLVIQAQRYSCDDPLTVAQYRIRFQGLWTKSRFPKVYPVQRPKAEWSSLIGELGFCTRTAGGLLRLM